MKISLEERARMTAELTRTSMSSQPGFMKFSEEYLDYSRRADIREVMVPTREGETRVYVVRPKELEKNCPVFINIHGGGFVKGHSERDTYFSSKIAERIGGIVVDVDYHTTVCCMFPTPFHECYDVAKWVFANCESWGADENRVSMGGHSAGATLTATVALKANQTKEFKLACQVLDYGEYDMFTDPGEKPGVEGSRFPAQRIRDFTSLYTEDEPELLNSPFVSALKASDELMTGLPETLVITAGKCPFRFEGEEYAKRLISCGVQVTAKRFTESDHSFVIACQGEWEEAQELIIKMLRNAGKN